MQDQLNTFIAAARHWSRCAVAASTPERRLACLRSRNNCLIRAREVYAAMQGDAVAIWSLDIAKGRVN